METKGIFCRWGAGLAFAGVALGAFGAHALKATLESHGSLETWKTGVLYHLVHAVALAAMGDRPGTPRGAAWCWVAGIFLFSGSLYLLSLQVGRAVMGPVTPLGGLCFLVGWAWLCVSAMRGR